MQVGGGKQITHWIGFPFCDPVGTHDRIEQIVEFQKAAAAGTAGKRAGLWRCRAVPLTGFPWGCKPLHPCGKRYFSFSRGLL